MRLAVFSDIHGHLTAFEAAWADFQAVGGADQIWFLGDFALAGPRPTECIQRVQAIIAEAEADETRKGTVRVIRGNTDRYLVTGQRMAQPPAADGERLAKMVEDLTHFNTVTLWGMGQLSYDAYAFLSKLPGECELYVPQFGYVIGYHGTPGSDEGFLTPETDIEAAADALLDREGRLGIGGHIHRQMDRLLPNGWRAVNVGSVGMSFDMPGKAQWGLFTFAEGGVTVDLRAAAYDLDAAMDDVYAAGHPLPAWFEQGLRRS